MAPTCDCGSGKIWEWGLNKQSTVCEDCKYKPTDPRDCKRMDCWSEELCPDCRVLVLVQMVELSAEGCERCGEEADTALAQYHRQTGNDEHKRPAPADSGQAAMLRKIEKWFGYPKHSQCAKEFYAETLRMMTASLAAEHEGSGTIAEIAKAYTHSMITLMCKGDAK